MVILSRADRQAIIKECLTIGLCRMYDKRRGVLDRVLREAGLDSSMVDESVKRDIIDRLERFISFTLADKVHDYTYEK